MTELLFQEKHILSFEILVITSEIDGYFDPRENDVIKEFFKGKDINNSDFFESIERLKQIPEIKITEHLQECAVKYAQIGTQKEKEDLISYLLKLINADEVIKVSESHAFTTVYNILNKNKNR